MATSHPPLDIRTRWLKWTARGLFAAAVAWMVIAWWSTGHRPAPPPQEPAYSPTPARTDWARVGWSHWQDPQSGIALEYPSIWRPDRLFDQFLETPFGDLKRAPIVGFREQTPVVIYRYTAPSPLPWDDWMRRATEGALREEFGSETAARTRTTVSGTPALDLRGEGATRGNLWVYRTLFFAAGKTGYRVTAGADARDWAVMAPVFDRLLKSVRFQPPMRP